MITLDPGHWITLATIVGSTIFLFASIKGKLESLTEQVKRINGSVIKHQETLTEHAEDISYLKGKQERV
jgi:hypothetical protein